MTISTVTTERLKQIASGNAFTCTQDDESASMAAELLAVREAQSGWTNNGQADAALVMLDRIDTIDTDDDERIEEVKRIVRLFAAPPAPAVPAELLDAMAEVIRISDRDHEAWNRAKAAISACRAAMLAAAPTPTKAGE
ncbi:hypothetical protein [Serratia fonticola]